MKDSTVVIMFGLACQTVIAIVAMAKGVDTLLIMTMAGGVASVVGAVAGYEYAKHKTPE